MRNLREILRLRFQARLSLRQIKASQRVSLGVVQKIVSQADALKLCWEKISDLDDQQLARLFYPESDIRSSNHFQCPDWAEAHRELRRKGVTKHLLWEEYTQAFAYLGGVPKLVVPDNLKSGVSKACRYDPDVNPAYQQLAAHRCLSTKMSCPLIMRL